MSSKSGQMSSKSAQMSSKLSQIVVPETNFSLFSVPMTLHFRPSFQFQERRVKSVRYTPTKKKVKTPFSNFWKGFEIMGNVSESYDNCQHDFIKVNKLFAAHFLCDILHWPWTWTCSKSTYLNIIMQCLIIRSCILVALPALVEGKSWVSSKYRLEIQIPILYICMIIRILTTIAKRVWIAIFEHQDVKDEFMSL